MLRTREYPYCPRSQLRLFFFFDKARSAVGLRLCKIHDHDAAGNVGSMVLKLVRFQPRANRSESRPSPIKKFQVDFRSHVSHVLEHLLH